MKKNYITMIISLLLLNFLTAQTTFEWNNAIDNGNNVTETINGITATLTGNTNDVGFVDASGLGNSSGNIIVNSLACTPETSITFSFSEEVDIDSILALNCTNTDIDFTFTPTGGSNSPVVASLINGTASVNLNWNNVTSFVVSTTTPIALGFDNLVLNSSTLSTNDFTLKTIKIFPNPSSDFIEITGPTVIENYEIYNTLGQEIKKGIVLENKKINIQNLTNGIYFLKFDNGNPIKFIKK